MDEYNVLSDQAWYLDLDEREQKEVQLARVYACDFHHGTSGHLAYTVMAKLADLLTERAQMTGRAVEDDDGANRS